VGLPGPVRCDADYERAIAAASGHVYRGQCGSAGLADEDIVLTQRSVAVLSSRSAGAETAAASYSGDDEFMGSSASTATTDPVITAKVTSAHPKTMYGWYRSPVTITFTCTAGSAPLTKPCPAPVTLSHSGAAQSVTRTITDTDGGIATVSVSPVNIDLIAPVVRVTGIENSATYEAPDPSSIACVASDSLSGLADHCALTVTRGPAHITWKATATDKAGNVTTITGKASLIDYYVAGVPRVRGFYQVKIGGSYLVKAFVITSKAPGTCSPLRAASSRTVNVGTQLHAIATQLRS
jgi:hypothetical protein